MKTLLPLLVLIYGTCSPKFWNPRSNFSQKILILLWNLLSQILIEDISSLILSLFQLWNPSLGWCRAFHGCSKPKIVYSQLYNFLPREEELLGGLKRSVASLSSSNSMRLGARVTNGDLYEGINGRKTLRVFWVPCHVEVMIFLEPGCWLEGLGIPSFPIRLREYSGAYYAGALLYFEFSEGKPLFDPINQLNPYETNEHMPTKVEETDISSADQSTHIDRPSGEISIACSSGTKKDKGKGKQPIATVIYLAMMGNLNDELYHDNSGLLFYYDKKTCGC